MTYTKAQIQAIANHDIAIEWYGLTDKQIFCEDVLLANNIAISLTRNEKQWQECIDWLEESLSKCVSFWLDDLAQDVEQAAPENLFPQLAWAEFQIGTSDQTITVKDVFYVWDASKGERDAQASFAVAEYIGAHNMTGGKPVTLICVGSSPYKQAA